MQAGMHADVCVVGAVRQSKVLREAGRIMDITKAHADAMRVAADHLAYLHNELEDMRAPAYDVATALEVLQTGGASPRRRLVTLPRNHARWSPALLGAADV